MRIAIIGATGYTGSALTKEALARGHQVAAIARRSAAMPEHPNVRAVSLDVSDVAGLAEHLRGTDVVISAFSAGTAGEDAYERQVSGFRSILEAVKRADVPRFLVVGGAGSLEVAPSVQLVDTPQFPAQWKANALATREALRVLRSEAELVWTFLSPAALLTPGTRTGTFRIGSDALMVDENGESRISIEDYAVAMIDEAENARHPRQRFSVAY